MRTWYSKSPATTNGSQPAMTSWFPALAASMSARRGYVEDGGTYVVLPPTGVHSQLQANAMPIEQLSGFKVTGRRIPGSITFAQQPSLFGFWAGRQFTGDGDVVDWKNNPITAQSGMALQPCAPGTMALR